MSARRVRHAAALRRATVRSEVLAVRAGPDQADAVASDWRDGDALGQAPVPEHRVTISRRRGARGGMVARGRRAAVRVSWRHRKQRRGQVTVDAPGRGSLKYHAASRGRRRELAERSSAAIGPWLQTRLPRAGATGSSQRGHGGVDLHPPDGIGPLPRLQSSPPPTCKRPERCSSRGRGGVSENPPSFLRMRLVHCPAARVCQSDPPPHASTTESFSTHARPLHSVLKRQRARYTRHVRRCGLSNGSAPRARVKLHAHVGRRSRWTSGRVRVQEHPCAGQRGPRCTRAAAAWPVASPNSTEIEGAPRRRHRALAATITTGLPCRAPRSWICAGAAAAVRHARRSPCCVRADRPTFHHLPGRLLVVSSLARDQDISIQRSLVRLAVLAMMSAPLQRGASIAARPPAGLQPPQRQASLGSTPLHAAYSSPCSPSLLQHGARRSPAPFCSA